MSVRYTIDEVEATMQRETMPPCPKDLVASVVRDPFFVSHQQEAEEIAGKNGHHIPLRLGVTDGEFTPSLSWLLWPRDASAPRMASIACDGCGRTIEIHKRDAAYRIGGDVLRLCQRPKITGTASVYAGAAST